MTLEPDHFICIQEDFSKQKQVVVIDPTDANNVRRRHSATLDPRSKILAKGERTINFVGVICPSTRAVGSPCSRKDTPGYQQQKVKSHVNNEDIVFWKWLSDKTIGMVTDTSLSLPLVHFGSDLTTPENLRPTCYASWRSNNQLPCHTRRKMACCYWYIRKPIESVCF
jgi:hypothetical protein